MKKVKIAFQRWWRKLSTAQKREIAKRAKTVPNYLDQIACGTRSLTVEMAGRIEHASESVSPIARGEAHPACAECPYWKAARRGRKG